ncbi:DNA-J related domain-containing protein [Alkalilimnicola sp. S0819]|uniref:DNA-J related domain-containing protein n=1 Tax=Alkalilimnicola sp. S0819 TaxID=2613922 RepID=UPI0012629B05|nr:DNA-J related domain-containing protein [Alkalilimnicola sp. S0819]KAB7623988.1 DnaJ domain-containing protein [Alkalilimnicola sp. S0819]MPQ16592.1 DnaJ domain-containing protein [Alkalilimnicola sp. S0819]
MSQSWDSWDVLLGAIEAQLRAHPAGLSEFALIRALQAAEVEGFAPGALSEPLSLYRTHFLLFHSLYRLRERLADEGLQIHCLRIKLLPTAERGAGDGLPAAPDSLADFYLDLRNRDNVDEAQVLEMLGAFWRAFKGRDARAEALAVLELQDPVEAADIKRQYRRLAMRHHPDRGGDGQRLQAINAAMAALGV